MREMAAVLAVVTTGLVIAIPGVLILAAMLGMVEPEIAAVAALVVGMGVMPVVTPVMILTLEMVETTPKARKAIWTT